MPVIINRSEPSNESPNGSKTSSASKPASSGDGSPRRRPSLLSGLDRRTQTLAASVLLIVAAAMLSWSLGLFNAKTPVTASNVIETPAETASESGVGAESGGAGSHPGGLNPKQNDSKGD